MDFTRPIQAVIPGAQGQLLAVLAETSAELNLRTLAGLAGVSLAQASRIMPGLVELGIVERREAPPSALFSFVSENVAAQALTRLASARRTVLADLGRTAAALDPAPVSVIVFGSFARGDGGPSSDLDLVVVRPDGLDEDDLAWRAGIDQWQRNSRRLTGNPVEILEVSASEATRRLRSRQPLWADVQADGIAVHGRSLADLRDARSA
jgi:predicted nucleotidyltransferase